MTLEEAKKFLSEKRPHVGRPPREWSERKQEAEKVVRAAEMLEASIIRATETLKKSSLTTVVAATPLKPNNFDFKPDEVTAILAGISGSGIKW